MMSRIPLSTSRIDLELKAKDRKLSLERFGLHDFPRSISLHSKLFSVIIDGKDYDISMLVLDKVATAPSLDGMKHCVARFDGPGFQVEYHLQAYAGTALVEIWPVIRNSGERACRVTRVDSASIEISGAGCDLLSFDSDWGQEFEPKMVPLLGKLHPLFPNQLFNWLSPMFIFDFLSPLTIRGSTRREFPGTAG